MSVTRDLFALQVEQLAHDEKVHQDILRLKVAEKLTHMTLHFAKYVGRFFDTTSPDQRTLENLVVDTAIIALASANIVNVRLDKATSAAKIAALRKTLSESDSPSAMIGQRLAVHTGQMAKACESLDHLERHSFRESLEENIVGIVELALVAADVLSVNLEHRIRQRWDAVEKKSIFHGSDKPDTRLKSVG